MVRKTVVSAFWVIALSLSMGSGAVQAFELNGFGDASFSKCTDPCPEEMGRNGNFAFGTLDLYLAEEKENVDILVELVIEEGAIIDLERLTLGYTFNDALKIRAGRVHTPLGFWNTSFHHGSQLQPTINRPEFLVFEDDGGILPVHTVGIYLSGRVKTDALTAEYGVLVGNGARMTSEDGSSSVISPNNVADNSGGKSVAFHAALSPRMVSGLKVGVSGHMARIQDDDSPGVTDVDVDQTILNASLMYTLGNLDLMGEYFSIKDEDKIGAAGDNTSNAYYGLISYTVADRWVPYLLYENMSVTETDPYFAALGTADVQKSVVGLRYNLSYRSSIKAEFRGVEWGSDDWNEYGIQWSLAF